MTSILILLSICQTPRPDILVADFEATDYGSWTVSGNAFGKGPARGTLPGQMQVEGFLGKGLVNSFLGGDDATGKLVSPPIKVERAHLNFLIGGGKNPEKLALRVILDGKVIASATGPNSQSGGSERLSWNSLDLSNHQGKEVRIEIVDEAKGGWGHINIDQITFSDKPRGEVTAQRILAADRFLHLPVRTGAPVRRLKVLDQSTGKILADMDIELCPEKEKASFWTFADLGKRQKGDVRLETRLDREDKSLEKILGTQTGPGRKDWFAESVRPLVHFTAPRGWLNDPNGLVFDGVNYHLFYQHNPYGWNWGNMHWGHATSPDLFKWTDKPEALNPKAYGDWAFSGSAVLDRDNTSGWGKEGKPPLVLAYTSTGRGECVAYSNDSGITWTEYEGNPVVKHNGRDPRLVWHAPTKKWIMAVYDEAKGQAIHFHSSSDLKHWTFESEIKNFYECPDLVRFPDPADPQKELWVLYGADGLYLVGDFDGKKFMPKGPKQRLWHGNFYAAQTFTNLPKSRVIQIGWGQGITFPGAAFNQQMTIPVELTLVSGPNGPRLQALPVEEIKGQVRTTNTFRNLRAQGGDLSVAPLSNGAQLIDITWKSTGGLSGIRVPGVEIQHDSRAGKLFINKMGFDVPKEGEIRLKMVLDRGSAEVFLGKGQQALILARDPKLGEGNLTLIPGDRMMEVVGLTVSELAPARKPIFKDTP